MYYSNLCFVKSDSSLRELPCLLSLKQYINGLFNTVFLRFFHYSPQNRMTSSQNFFGYIRSSSACSSHSIIFSFVCGNAFFTYFRSLLLAFFSSSPYQYSIFASVFTGSSGME